MPEKFSAFLLFTIVGSVTPGPNTMISTASGAAFGFRRTLPQMFGVAVGFALMLVLFGFGLGQIFQQLPWLHNVLRIAGVLFILYFAWRIAIASGPQRADASRPFTFLQAAAFQWLNPKAWTLAIGTIAAFTTPGLPLRDFLTEIGVVAGISGVTAFASLVCWCLFGVMIARALQGDRRRRIFQLTLATLLALSVVFLFV